MNMIDMTLNRYRIDILYFRHVFSCIFNIGEYIWTAIMGNSNDFDVFLIFRQISGSVSHFNLSKFEILELR